MNRLRNIWLGTARKGLPILFLGVTTAVLATTWVTDRVLIRHPGEDAATDLLPPDGRLLQEDAFVFFGSPDDLLAVGLTNVPPGTVDGRDLAEDGATVDALTGLVDVDGYRFVGPTGDVSIAWVEHKLYVDGVPVLDWDSGALLSRETSLVWRARGLIGNWKTGPSGNVGMGRWVQP